MQGAGGAPEKEALDFGSVLGLDPETGVLTRGGTRVVVIGTSLLSSIRNALLSAYPLDQVRTCYWKAGYDQGYQECLSIAQTMDISEGLDLVKLGSAFAAPSGRGRMDIEKFDVDVAAGRFTAWCRFAASYEAIEHVRQFGSSKEGVCWVLGGYAQGFVEALVDAPAFVVETECMAMGHAACRLVVTTDSALADASRAAVSQAAPAGGPGAVSDLREPSAEAALTHDRILEIAGRISPADRDRFVDYFTRKEADLERTRLKYRALIDASPDVVLEVNREGRILVANEPSRALFGKPPEAVVGMSLASLFLPEEREAVDRFLGALKGEPLATLPRLRLADGAGATRLVELAVKAIGPSPEWLTAVAEIRDVTERSRLESDVREREGRLRAIFEGVADGIVVWGADGRITQCNAAAERMLKYGAGTLAGVPIDDVVDCVVVPGGLRGARPKVGAPRSRGLTGLNLKRRFVGDGDLLLKNGEKRAALLSITPLKGEKGVAGHIALLKDVSELKTLREALRVERVKTDAILEAISAPMVIFSAEGTLEWHNVHAEFVFGRRRLVQGTPCNMFLCDSAAVCDVCPTAAMARGVQNPGTVTHRAPLRTTDGEVHPFELTLRRLTDAAGAPRTLVLFRDISKEAGREREVLERLRRDDLNLEVSEILLSSVAMPELLERFADRVAAVLKLSTLAVLLKVADDWLEPAAAFHGATSVVNLPTRIPAGNTGLKPVVAGGETVLYPDADKSAGASSLLAVLERAGAPPASSLAIAPLKSRALKVIGALVVGRAEVDAFEDADLELLREIALRLGLALDGVLLAQANARVLKLQAALLAESEALAASPDVERNARRFIEILAEATGAPSGGLIYLFADRKRVRLFSHYSRAAGHQVNLHDAAQVEACPVLARLVGEPDVKVIDIRSMLKVEREDQVLKEFLDEGAESLVLIPVAAGPDLSGWIALALPPTFRVSTDSEVEVLRTIGQQSRLGLAALIASGQAGDLVALLEGRRPGAA